MAVLQKDTEDSDQKLQWLLQLRRDPTRQRGFPCAVLPGEVLFYCICFLPES